MLVCSFLPSMADETEKTWAVQGKAVTADGVKDGWVVFKGGLIIGVGVSETAVPANATRINWDGYIFPGLIDTHNHVDWNSIPQWTAGPFKSRYDWLEDTGYKRAVSEPHEQVVQVIDDSRKYGELRALIGGTTLIQGSYKGRLPDILVRNLDERYKAGNYIPKISDLAEAKRIEFIRRLDNPDAPDGLKRLFFHIGEGLPSDATCSAEFFVLKQSKLAREGVVCIHGLALSSKDFAEMAKSKMCLVWSPVSNWNLYRAVTDIPAAMKAGLLISLAPDWTVSGSDNLLEEMKFAYAVGRSKWGQKLTAKDIFKMATVNAAKVAGVDKGMVMVGYPQGTLDPGYAADLFLAPSLEQKEGGADDPYESLLRTYPKHFHLVFIDGKPVYGDKGEMDRLTVGADDITIQNTHKAVITTGGDTSKPEDQVHLPTIQKSLEGKLKDLAPLVEN